MSRSRPSGIQRLSRPLIGAIAVTGASLTGYLTYEKLTGGEVACSLDAANAANSCGDVLSSPYATVFGLPLSLFGFLAYFGMATFALSPLLLQSELQKKLRNQLEDWTWLLLLMGSTAMTVFSGYLMYVLFFKLEAVCYYCIGSALFSLSLLTLTLLGREWEDFGQVFFTGIIVTMITLVGTLGVYANVNKPVPTNAAGQIIIPLAKGTPEPPSGWEITTTSGESEIALAKHLKTTGIKMYGAFWCPHCYEQKQLFGKEAFQLVNSIECDPRGKNPQPEACQKAGIQSFPTWEVKGKIEPGVRTLAELAQLSDYQGATDFKYALPNQ